MQTDVLLSVVQCGYVQHKLNGVNEMWPTLREGYTFTFQHFSAAVLILTNRRYQDVYSILSGTAPLTSTLTSTWRHAHDSFSQAFPPLLHNFYVWKYLSKSFSLLYIYKIVWLHYLLPVYIHGEQIVWPHYPLPVYIQGSKQCNHTILTNSVVTLFVTTTNSVVTLFVTTTNSVTTLFVRGQIVWSHYLSPVYIQGVK